MTDFNWSSSICKHKNWLNTTVQLGSQFCNPAASNMGQMITFWDWLLFKLMSIVIDHVILIPFIASTTFGRKYNATAGKTPCKFAMHVSYYHPTLLTNYRS